MARRTYVRDNRGRFASTGATARGGRLKTAAGNKRATQTERIAGGKSAGTIGKPRGLKPGSIKPKNATPKPAAAKPGFSQSDFSRRSARTAGIRNPQVKATAQRLYGRTLDSGATPRQLERAFRTTGKYSTVKKPRGAAAPRRRSNKEHQDMLKAANRLFK